MSDAPQITKPADRPEVRRGEPLRIDIQRGVESDESEWQTLAEAAARGPFAEPFWHRAWASSFLADPASLEVCKVRRAGQLVAVLPLVRQGRLTRRLTYPFNPHVPLTTLAFRGNEPGLLGQSLAALAEYADVVRFPAAPWDGSTQTELLGLADASAVRVLHREQVGRAVLPIGDGSDGLQARLSKNLVQTTSRKKRQLARMGELAFDAIGAQADLDAVLDECFALEAATWKGANASAIASNRRTLGFYGDLARQAHAAGALGLYTLRLDRRVIAFEYCLRRDGIIYLLKLSFDPDLSKQSPGNVLRMGILEHEIAHGRPRLYDFGIASEWKTRWTQDILPLRDVTLYFGHNRGRAAYWLGPGLRRAVKSAPGVARLVEWRRRRRAERKAARKNAAKAMVAHQHENDDA